MSLKSIKKQTAGDKTFGAATAPLAPVVSSYTISGTDDTALDPAGGQTIFINGTGFKPGATITLSGTAVSIVSYVSPNRLSFTSPAKSAGTYTIYVTNTDGGTGIYAPGIVYSTFPTWTTSAGSIGSYYETKNISNTFVATSDSAIANYTVVSGALPIGATLYANGVLSGTAPVDSGSTTYNFTIQATDTELQDSTRSFSLTINTDVVTWSSPADGTTYNITNTPISNVTLSATSAAGYNVSYSANALPTGISLTGNTISGTASVAGSTTSLLTATAATTSRSATRTINWVVTLGDTYWKYVSLLLNGATPTTTFINDASLNNNQLTLFGDTKSNNFSPYDSGYYSALFDGDGDYLTVPNNTALQMGSGDFTIEFWIYYNSIASYQSPITKGYTAAGDILFQTGLGDGVMKIWLSGSNVITEATAAVTNQWYHYALVRSGTTVTLYRDGVSRGTTTSSVNFNTTDQLGIGATGKAPGGGSVGQWAVNGYMSNVRIVKGTAVYTTTFTPSTTPLTAIPNTVLLTCQDNRFIDDSLNNFTVTRNGNSSIRPAHPFTTPTTVAYNSLYSTSFDGTGDYLSLSGTMSAIGTNDFTVEMWIRVTISGTYNVLDFTPSGLNGAYLNFYLSSMTPALYVNSANRITGGAALNVGQWYHVAISRVSGNTRMFIDGTQSGSTWADTTSYLSPANRPVVCTSGNNIGANYMPGLVSNLRIINGTGLYSGNFTPPTSSLTAVTNTSLLTCQNSTLIDNSTNNFTITSFADARPIAVSPFTMTTSNLTVTSLGSTYFDGTGDYISWNPGAAAKFGTGDFTVELWFYPTITMTTHYLLEMRDASNLTGWVLAYGVNVSGSITWYNGTGNLLTEASPLTRINQWNHVAFCRSGTSNRLFINGVQTNVTVTDATNYNNNNTTAYIGSRFDQNTTITTLFTGYIADIRIVKGTALYTSNFLLPQAPLTPVTNTTLLTLQYNGGANNNSFVDQSSFNNLITRVGNTTQGTFSPYSQNGWSYYYPALAFNTYAANPIGTFGTGATFTVEGWVNMAVYPTTNYFLNLLASCDQSTLLYWSIGIGSTGLATVYWYDGNPKQAAGSTTLARGVWYHVAAVVTSGIVKIYINGTQETLTGTTTLTNPTGNSSYTTGTDRGSSNGGSAGYISNLRMSTTAVYSSSFTPSTTPLSPLISSTVNATLLTAQSSSFIDNSITARAITLGSTSPTVQAYSPFGGVTSVPTSYSTFFVRNNGDYISSPASSAFAFGTSAYTIEGWAYFNTIATYLTIFEVFDGTVGPKLTTMADGALRLWNGEGAYSTTSTGVVTTNLWYHFAWVRESTSLLKLYINGTSVISVTSGTVVTQNLTGTPTVKLGTFTNYTHYMNGYISNFRITKGQALYTTTFTPSTSPLTTTSQGATASNVSLLTCQSNTMIDNSLNYFTITATNTPRQTSVNPFGLSNTTNVSYTPSVNGGSMYFDGTGDNLTVPSSPNWSFGTGNFTIEFWMYTTDTSCGILVPSVSANTGYWALLINSGSLTWQSAYFATTLKTASLTGYLNNSWVHVAVVRSSGSLNFYFNGVVQGTATSDTTNYNGAANSMWIGYDGGGTGYYTGYISDLRIVNGVALYTSGFVPPVTPLTPTTTIGTAIASSVLLLNGTSGGIIDYHSSNILETVANTQLAIEDPYAGSYYSYRLVNAADTFQVTGGSTNMQLTGDFTVEFWIFATDSTASYMQMLSRTGGNTDTLKMALSGSAWYFYFYNGSSYDYSTNIVQANKWNHIVWERSGTTSRMYINGVGQTAVTTMTATVDWSTLYVGASNASEQYFGYFSNLRVIKGTCLYNISQSTLTVPTSPLTAVANTQLLTAQANKFIDNSSNNLAITKTGSTKVVSQNPFQQNTGKSMYFDGTDDYAGILNNPTINLARGDYTAECWFYTTASNQIQTILWFNGNTSAYSSLRLGITNTSINFYVGADGSSWGINSGNIGTFIVNQWNHIAVSRSGADYKVFLNGTQIGSTYTAPATIYSTGTLSYIGALNNASGGTTIFRLFYGYITSVRITNGYARYTTTFTPPTDALPTK